MAMSDRAFRALAQAEPQVIVATLCVLAPGVVDQRMRVTTANLTSTRHDALAPPMEADLGLFLGDDALLHMECQGYGDRGFASRVLRYHLWYVLRHFERRVRTVALWLYEAPSAQRESVIHHHDVTVNVTQVVLPRVPAEVLVDNPMTACFAAGAHRGSWSEKELCTRVAKQLAAGPTNWYRAHMAVVAAASQGRYDSMINAMEEQGIEPVIIEDIILIGRDQGIKIGKDEGIKIGALDASREGLIEVLSARGMKLTPAQRKRIDACADLATLKRWFTQALKAKTARAALDG
jgi:hypothetical protein